MYALRLSSLVNVASASRLSNIGFSKAATRAFAADSDRTPVIVSYARTPIGSLQSKLAHLSAPKLGAAAIKEAVKRAGIKPEEVQEVLMGHVISSGAGQAAFTQASTYAGLPQTTIASGINKVCASGTKAVMFASQSIMLGLQDIMVAGGMESMSQVPHYLLDSRNGFKLGNANLADGILRDGLVDAYSDKHMGNCAEKCSRDFNISREAQDAYALESYARAQKAQKNGTFAKEIIAVPGAGKDAVAVDADEEPFKLRADKVATLRPAFEKDGVVTAANSSKLNDGAAALVLMSAGKAKQLGLTPLARVRGFADAQLAPVDFTIAPAQAIPRALANAGLKASDVSFYEINEAFSAVALANMKLLNISADKINVYGGAVALGHPIGMSGARIVGTLANILRDRNGSIGVASICNGGGGASAIVIERL